MRINFVAFNSATGVTAGVSSGQGIAVVGPADNRQCMRQNRVWSNAGHEIDLLGRQRAEPERLR